MSAPAAANGGAAGADDGASAGLGGTPSNSADAGATGATTSECAQDLDCDDGSFCNGAEECRMGACVPGTALACENGTTCVEGAADAACTYAEPSPWLLLLTNRQLLGLPTAELGRRPLLALGEYPSAGLFIGFNEVVFTPDGRHALIDYLLPDFGQQVLELTFDAGVPKPVRPVKNLPNWGIYSVPAVSPDSSRALVFESGSGAYLLDLAGPTAVPTRLELPGFEGWQITFCAASDSWLKASSSSTLYSLEGGQPLPTTLDGDVVAVSPDGQKVWLRGEHARIVSCAAGAESGVADLPDAEGTWSPDSRWLLASLDDGAAKLFSVSPALATNEVWSSDALGASAWSADGRALLVRHDGGAEPTFSYIDLAGELPVEHPLGLAGDASIGPCSEKGCLVFVPRVADDGVDLLWQPFLEIAATSLLASPLSGDDSLVWADFTGNRLLLRRAAPTGAQLTLTDFQGSPEQAVFDLPDGSLDARPASDGSGLLVQLSNDSGYSNYWLRLVDPDGKSDPGVVPLDVPAYRTAFQPWSRSKP